MSKFGIFILGIILGQSLTLFAVIVARKGREDMKTAVLDRPTEHAINEKSLDEQLMAAILKRNPQCVTLPSDETGNVIIDKEEYPGIYDWVVNG